jgi:hypothetical protein
MTSDLPPIYKLAEQLLTAVELAVGGATSTGSSDTVPRASGFAKKNRRGLGEDLRDQAMTIVRHCNRAWYDKPRKLHWTGELKWAIDEIKISLRLGQRLRAFRSFAEFETLIRLAEDLGRQAGGWHCQLQQHQGQNAASRPASQRAQTLSAAAASTGANP